MEYRLNCLDGCNICFADKYVMVSSRRLFCRFSGRFLWDKKIYTDDGMSATTKHYKKSWCNSNSSLVLSYYKF